MLLEQRVFALDISRLTRLEHVALVTLDLPAEDVELQLRRPHRERRGFLRLFSLLLEGEAMLDSLPVLGPPFLFRHGDRT